jgi:archaellum component FlaG (FlaF/FlaG flagellin family)
MIALLFLALISLVNATVSILYPKFGEIVYINNSQLTFTALVDYRNYYIIEVFYQAVLYNVDLNVVEILNGTSSSNYFYITRTFNNVSPGRHVLYVFVSARNENDYYFSSDSVNFTVVSRNNPPQLTIHYPLDGQRFYGDSLDLYPRFEIIDNDPRRYEVYLNGNLVENRSISASGNYSSYVRVLPGNHTLTVIAYDSVGSTQRSVRFELIGSNRPPQLTIHYPLDGQRFYGDSLDLYPRFEIIDNDPRRYEVYLNGNLVENRSISASGNYSSYVRVLPGNHTLTVIAYDSVGSTQRSVRFELIGSNRPPQLTIHYPLDGQRFYGDSLDLYPRFEIIDNDPRRYEVYLNGNLVENRSISTSGNYSSYVRVLPGNHTLTVIAYDSVGSTQRSVRFELIGSNRPPQLTIHYPLDGQRFYGDSLDLYPRFEIIDNDPRRYEVYLNGNLVENRSISASGNYSSYVRVLPGNHTLTVIAYDSVGSTQRSVRFELIGSNRPPQLTIQYPLDGQRFYGDSLDLYPRFEIIDNDPRRYEVYLNGNLVENRSISASGNYSSYVRVLPGNHTLTVIAYDSVGSTQRSVRFELIGSNRPPQLTIQYPLDGQRFYGDSLDLYPRFEIIDNDPRRYEVYLNGNLVENRSISASGNYSSYVRVLPGNHTLTVIAYDSVGSTQRSVRFELIGSNRPPQLTIHYPLDGQRFYGDSLDLYPRFEIIDNDPRRYEVYLNGNLVENRSISASGNYSSYVRVLPGNHTLTVIAYDSVGSTQRSVRFELIGSNRPPQLTIHYPLDGQRFYGDSLDLYPRFEIIDNDPRRYEVYLNGNLVENRSISASGNYSSYVRVLPGNHTLTVIAYDSVGSTQRSVRFELIGSNRPPQLTIHYPLDGQRFYGDSLDLYPRFEIIDNDPRRYEVYLNGNLVENRSISASGNYSSYVRVLPGNHTLTVIAYDSVGSTQRSVRFELIGSNRPPQLTIHYPLDGQRFYGDSLDLYPRFEIIDNDPRRYEVYLNGNLVENRSISTSGNYSSYVRVLPGNHTLTVIAYDSVGSTQRSVRFELIGSNRPPQLTIHYPLDGQRFYGDSLDLYPRFEIIDNDPRRYEVYLNGNLVENRSISTSGNYSSYVRVLPGNHTLTVIAYDSVGSTQRSVRFELIGSNRPPQLTIHYPLDGQRFYGDSLDLYPRFEIIDNDPRRYEVYLNGNLVENRSISTSGNYSSYVRVLPGNHTLTVIAYDSVGSTQRSVRFELIGSNRPPQLTIHYPLDGQRFYGDSLDLYPRFEIIDNDPRRYEVYLNGNLVENRSISASGNYSSYVRVLPGNHTLTVIAYDSVGSTQRSVRFELIGSNRPPQLTIHYPLDGQRFYGDSLDLYPRFEIIDNDPRRYEVYLNGNLVENRSISTSGNYSSYVRVLPGNHTLTVIAYDSVGSTQRSVRFELIGSNRPPQLTIHYPLDGQRFYGDSLDLYPRFEIIDNDPRRYEVYLNGNLVENRSISTSGNYSSYVRVLPGNHTLTVIAYDSVGSTQRSVRFELIGSNRPPQLTIHYPLDGQRFYGDSLDLYPRFEIIDNDPRRYEVYLNGNLVENRSISASGNYSSYVRVLPGNHTLTVIAYDSVGSTQRSVRFELVRERNRGSPDIEPYINIISPSREVRNSSVDIIFESDGYRFVLYLNGFAIDGGYLDGRYEKKVVLSDGLYNLTISVYNARGREVSKSILFVVNTSGSKNMSNTSQNNSNQTNITQNVSVDFERNIIIKVPESSTSKNISLTIQTLNISTDYEIYLNGMLIKSDKALPNRTRTFELYLSKDINELVILFYSNNQSYRFKKIIKYQEILEHYLNITYNGPTSLQTRDKENISVLVGAKGDYLEIYLNDTLLRNISVKNKILFTETLELSPGKYNLQFKLYSLGKMVNYSNLEFDIEKINQQINLEINPIVIYIISALVLLIILIMLAKFIFKI